VGVKRPPVSFFLFPLFHPLTVPVLIFLGYPPFLWGGTNILQGVSFFPFSPPHSIRKTLVDYAKKDSFSGVPKGRFSPWPSRRGDLFFGEFPGRRGCDINLGPSGPNLSTSFFHFPLLFCVLRKSPFSPLFKLAGPKTTRFGDEGHSRRGCSPFKKIPPFFFPPGPSAGSALGTLLHFRTGTALWELPQWTQYSLIPP